MFNRGNRQMSYLLNTARLLLLIAGFESSGVDWKSRGLWISLLPTGWKDLIQIGARIVGGLSVLAIAVAIYSQGFSTVIISLVETYDDLVTAFFLRTGLSWIAGHIAAIMQFVFALDVTLEPYWKHIFTLMSFYIAREVALNLASKLYWTSLFNASHGLVVAFVFSIASGLVGAGSANTMDSFLVVAFPVYAAAIYQFVGIIWDATYLREYQAKIRGLDTPPAWWEHFKNGLGRGTTRTVVGLTIALIGVHIPCIQNLDSPGLILAAGLMLLFGVYWFIDGIFQFSDYRKSHAANFDTYIRHDHVKLGAAIVGSFCWAIIWAAGVTNF